MLFRRGGAGDTDSGAFAPEWCRRSANAGMVR
jgi:hypothetical protein